ncbi:MAG: AAA family ATPase [Anaerolineae bacterium]|nr:AAA family ATPase [Anaerolineae bacterium]
MIEQLEIHNFRGIGTGKLDRLRQFNLLVGPNNAGKTAVLELIYLASTANRSASLIVSDQGRSESYTVGLPARDMLNQHPTNHLSKRHKHSGVTNGSNRFSQDILQVTVDDERVPINTFDLAVDNAPLTERESLQIYLFRLQPNPDEIVRLMEFATQLMGHPLEDWPDDQKLVFCWQRELTHFYKGSANWWVKGNLPPANHVLYYDMLNVQEHLPANFYEEMLATVPGWTQKIAQRFARIFDLPDSFTVQFLPTKNEPHAIQGWIAPEESTAVPIDAWGDGARSAFKLLTPLIALAHLATPAMPAMLLWEEPEMFQNPQTLGKLLREVADIVRGKPIQVFMVSHSLEVVAHLTQMLQEGALSPDDTRAFLLNLQQGHLKSTWFDADNLLTWLETGLDPRVWGDFLPPVQFRLAGEVVE